MAQSRRRQTGRDSELATYNAAMVLTTQELSLISVVRMLPSEEASKVFSWARHLTELSAGGPIQWSDAWSDEDLSDATASAFERLENREKSSC